jgi:hypothetical protein
MPTTFKIFLNIIFVLFLFNMISVLQHTVLSELTTEQDIRRFGIHRVVRTGMFLADGEPLTELTYTEAANDYIGELLWNNYYYEKVFLPAARKEYARERDEDYRKRASRALVIYNRSGLRYFDLNFIISSLGELYNVCDRNMKVVQNVLENLGKITNEAFSKLATGKDILKILDEAYNRITYLILILPSPSPSKRSPIHNNWPRLVGDDRAEYGKVHLLADRQTTISGEAVPNPRFTDHDVTTLRPRTKSRTKTSKKKSKSADQKEAEYEEFQRQMTGGR